MKYDETPRFGFSSDKETLIVSFNNHPLKNGKDIHFSRRCESELEAKLLCDFMAEMLHVLQKEYFTRGFDAHKRREKNYYL